MLAQWLTCGTGNAREIEDMAGQASKSPFSRAISCCVGARECTGDTSRASKRHGKGREGKPIIYVNRNHTFGNLFSHSKFPSSSHLLCVGTTVSTAMIYRTQESMHSESRNSFPLIICLVQRWRSSSNYSTYTRSWYRTRSLSPPAISGKTEPRGRSYTAPAMHQWARGRPTRFL